MTFPTGWTHRFKITVDHTKVTGTPTDFVMFVGKDMLPASVIDAGSTSAQDGGGDIRFTSDAAGTNRLPIDVVDFHPNATSGSRRCEIWVNTAGFEPSSAVDTIYYGWCKGPTIMQQPAPSMPYGAHATWLDGGYRLINHSNDSYAPEATGLWLVRPRAVEYNGFVYVTWLDYLTGGTGNIRASKYNCTTGVWSTAVTVSAGLQSEAHAAPSICVDTGGYIHITWGGYQASGGYLYTSKSTTTEDISAWGAVVTVTSGASEPTYPCMLALSTGNLVLFSRESDQWKRRVSTDDGATWGDVQTILLNPRAYVEWQLGASDRVHCAWHVTSASGAVNEPNLYYIYSDNPAAATSTWKAIDGSTLTMPVTADVPNTISLGRVYDGGSFTTGYFIGVSADGSNNPMLVHALYDSGTPANNNVSSFTWNGSSWDRTAIVTGAGVTTIGARGEGGVRHVSGTTWRAITTMTVSSMNEVQEFETTNGGTSWAKIRDVTLASTRGNTQPQYVRGTTGGVDSTLYSGASGNDLGGTYNTTNDLWFCGEHTDGGASEAANLIAVSGYQRDSSKYRNHATGSANQAADIMPIGGYARLYNAAGTYKYDISASSTWRTDCKDSMTLQWWAKHTANGSNEKNTYTEEGGGVTAMIQAYKTSNNAQQVSFGNGSALCAVATANNTVVAGTAYRLTSQYDGQSHQWVNKTKTSGTSVAGPLNYTASAPLTIGRSVVGHLDEIRVTPTVLTAALIDTEYDNQNSPSTFGVGSESPLFQIAWAANANTLIGSK